MSKYDPLRRHLMSLSDTDWEASFADIEAVLGFALPKSARTRPEWWSNNATGHSHARAWLEIGWRTGNIDLKAERIRFSKAPDLKAPLSKVSGAPGFAETETDRYRVGDAGGYRPIMPAPSGADAGMPDRTLVLENVPPQAMARLQAKARLSGRSINAVANEILLAGTRLTGAEKISLIEDMRAAVPRLGDIDVPALIRAGRDDER